VLLFAFYYAVCSASTVLLFCFYYASVLLYARLYFCVVSYNNLNDIEHDYGDNNNTNFNKYEYDMVLNAS